MTLEILKIACFLSGHFVLCKGVIRDIKERRFSLNDFLQAAGLGLLYQLFLMEGLSWDQINGFILFLIFNIASIFIYQRVKISAGDLKFLSVSILFLDLHDPSVLILYMLCVIGIGLLWFLFWPWIHYHSLSEIKEHYQMEFWNIRSFIYTQQTISDLSNLEGDELKKRSHPYTVQLYLALVLTTIGPIFA